VGAAALMPDTGR